MERLEGFTTEAFLPLTSLNRMIALFFSKALKWLFHAILLMGSEYLMQCS